MNPSNIRIRELQKEIDNLTTLRDEAKSEWNQHSDEYLLHKNKAERAEKRMHDLDDEIQYRLSEIAELEEQSNSSALMGVC
ncbi:hypothetical protein HP567_012840 [Brevibacillus sp. M2.1A]|uniref:hypothetical protein n=1 Tax=Brevibacillus sp. M2.1A TaxID=2738980 RepID=UPI00156B491B|nr:hypothetical protein [Brevibacillus sp. M2.1A]MCC8435432.1 hypothetical protein [Brevibacillus sp. M2.1A]